MKLLIISHTEHYKSTSGEVVGWGPTITEINHLTEIFDEIYHCAPLYEDPAPNSSLPYLSDRIKFVPLKPFGGESLRQKLTVLTTAPYNLNIIKETLKKVDIFQFRAPTGMGVYVIPWLMYFSGKKGWFKYAGNWNQKKPPLGYAFQRFILTKQNSKAVTINGSWPKQPKHCLTFENPCLDERELKRGQEIIKNKDYTGKLNFCFAGRLESAKGVGRILNVFKNIANNKRIGKIHFIGDGPEKGKFIELSKDINLNIIFHGFLARNKVADIFAECHVFLLPSTASEGFPKVIAEAANYGCVPVVSNVSSIGQYVKDGKNGYIVDVNGKIEHELKNKLLCLFGNNELKDMAFEASKFSKLFTFEHYNYRIKNVIINR